MARFVQTFLAELRRRRVLRVLAIYAVAAWVVLQIGEVTFEPLGISQEVMRGLIVLALAGFPLAFVLAWLIEVGPRGLMFDLPLWPRAGDRAPRGRRSDLALALGVLALTVIGAYTAFGMLGEEAAEAPTARADNSIAVLAFDSFDTSASTDYFASGLAEEIINLLSGIERLNVASRTSSFQFRGERVDVREIARLLGVARVLEGSVRRDGERLRVTAQLTDGESGFQLWRQTYDRRLSDVFAIQREIGEAVVNELQIALSVEVRDRLGKVPTTSLDAYLFYLQGLDRLHSSQDENVMRVAIELFDRALELDPRLARALAGRCEAGLRLYQIGNDVAQFERAEADCQRAADLDTGLDATTHVALARLYRFRGWTDRAEAQLERARAIAPAEVDVYLELGRLRSRQDREQEAEASFLRAVDLKRNDWRTHDALATFYYRNERYREALQSYTMVTRLAPDIATAFSGAGAAHWMLGEVDAAGAAWERSLALKPSRQAFTNLGLRYYYAGRFEEAADMQRQALELAPDDHRVWGRLAESLRFLAEGEGESLAAYRRAAELAEGRLRIDASDWSTQGLLGLYRLFAGERESGMRLLHEAVSGSGRSAETLYYQAIGRVQFGDAEGALDALEEALAKDPQYRQFLLKDPDLAALRDAPRFELLATPDGAGVGEP
ncbi:tetratricopeptide repeat protein [Pseudomarimonas salicorniae]|uniref:Tetratricopeptide repeat protein n=1 Tax=Pseudomarimonas salicorniae TaxID=2933270 RepID=A0ABT0GJC2_9GAMM|nr:tetratricopeptide repeat protein [Lysobacter sp. CAU 1642]MCK7594646.1 tetratricopeptide repeat protein [Lysobacter sp. CAU 1642]